MDARRFKLSFGAFKKPRPHPTQPRVQEVFWPPKEEKPYANLWKFNDIESVSFEFNLVYVGILVSEVNHNGLDATIMR